MLSDVSRCYLELLKSVVTGEAPTFESLPNMDEVFSCAKLHNTLALIWYAASKCPQLQNIDALNSAKQQAVASVIDQCQRTESFLVVYDKLLKSGVKPLVLKGIICRELYGKLRDYRPSGDEDLLVTVEDFYRVQSVLLSEGFIQLKDFETEKELKKLQEITFEHKKTRLHLEVHINAIGLETEQRVRLNRQFSSVFEHAVAVTVQKHTLYTLSPTDHLCYLFLHLYKHFCHHGVGVRQILDVLLFLREYRGEIDFERLKAVIKESRTKDFWEDLLTIGNRYFGFQNNDSDDHHADELIEDCLGSGAFGLRVSEERHFGNILADLDAKPPKTKLQAAFLIGFPPPKIMYKMYPQLQNKKFLLPAFWLRRIFGFLHKYGPKGIRAAAAGAGIGEQRSTLQSKYEK